MACGYAVIAFTALTFLGECQAGGHSSQLCPHHDKGCSEIDMAIIHIDWTYDDHVCGELVKLNCDTVVTANLVDEQVCGTDGQTYDSHCLFAQARCQAVQHHNKHGGDVNILNIQKHGPCSNYSLTTSQVTQTTHAHAPESTTHAPTSMPIVTAQTTSTSGSTAPVISTTSTAPNIGSTTMSTEHLMAQIYCQNVHLISCDGDLEVICGSDGQLYPNKCELTKAVCKNSSLHQLRDTTLCLP